MIVLFSSKSVVFNLAKSLFSKCMFIFVCAFCFRFLTTDGKTNLVKYDSQLRSYNKFHYAGGKPVVTSEVGFRTERMDFWFKYMFGNTFVCSNAVNMTCMYSYITLLVISLLFVKLCQNSLEILDCR